MIVRVCFFALLLSIIEIDDDDKWHVHTVIVITKSREATMENRITNLFNQMELAIVAEFYAHDKLPPFKCPLIGILFAIDAVIHCKRYVCLSKFDRKHLYYVISKKNFPIKLLLIMSP